MAKHIIKGFLQWNKDSWRDTGSFEINKYEFKTSENSTYATVRPIEIEVDVPDDFDPTPGVIADLQEQKRLLRLKLAAELADLDDRISKLSALTFEAA
jgi:hypothetical protein